MARARPEKRPSRLAVEILGFWLGDSVDGPARARARHEVWYRGGEALDAAKEGGASEESLAKLAQAAELAPDAVLFTFEWARMAAELGHADEALAGLERVLASAGRDDRQYRMMSRQLFGELLERAGRTREARQQYRLVLDDAYLLEVRERAEAGLKRLEATP